MKKTTKRKMYHKRRKKEKADQRRNDNTEAPPTNKPRLSSKYKCNKNVEYPRKHNKHFRALNYQYPEIFNPLNSYTQGLQVWWHTYCTAIQYHTNQQNLSNKKKKHQEDTHTTADSYLKLLEKYANEYETSSEEEDNEQHQQNCLQHLDDDNYFLGDTNNIDTNADVDAEYLKFLEITLKHREELKLKRAEEDF